MKLRVLVVGFVAITMAFGAPTDATAESEASRSADFTKAESAGRLSTPIRPQVLDASAKVDVMVQLSGDPVAVVQAKAAHRLSKSQRNAVKAKLRKAQNAITDDITKRGGKVTAKLQSAYNGMRVTIKGSRAASLASLPGVTGVHAITAKALDNTVSVPFIGAPQVWQNAGLTGKGVKVAIIDTGIDYTHADFGGPGTSEAFQDAAAKSTQTIPADSTLFGANAPRVKGGYDFVGDDYDAATTAKATPAPDANPLDCQGHGTHVAGTAAGGGVTSDGKAYTGPYNQSTSSNTFKVGPGVAPQVDLYALRVFGCTGSTDVAVEAIDWAVDHGMDVINMSLGSSFGRSNDPDAVAASNAVAAGVVVVASSGNSGQSPYMTGSPASGQGVISVAAMDSTGTFPGASLGVGGKTVSAINANGASLPAGDFEVVAVADDPATDENEALGCSTSAFAKAGITTTDSTRKIAVVSRGTCARVAKAIFGQQAGAAAVLMVNSDDQYPSYEGEITSNPDDGVAYHVTIPFLGVRSSDGAVIKASSGQPLTMVANSLDNPSFHKLASFSSGGPTNGESGLSPNVAAPGVSISSAAVGTGSGSEIMSGTSMAAPQVTGVAALGVQAHPKWTASQVAASVVGTADPGGIYDYSVPGGGAGLVDPKQMVKTEVVVTGDEYRTKSGRVQEASLSFGFAEPSVAFVGTKTIKITNTSKSARTYTLSNAASDQSRPATVRFSSKTVRVPAKRTVKVAVTLLVSATTIGTSQLANDQFAFREVSGNVVLTSTSEVLRVPYLLVPRAKANVIGQLSESRSGHGAQPSPSVQGKKTLNLANPGGALGAYADVYTWGLTDGADVAKNSGGSGYDLRAAGVQSFAEGDDQLLVFAVNNHDRWSNAATDEFDISVDTNGDGKAEYVVFTYDSGAIRSGSFDGTTEVFVVDAATGALSAAGFLAGSPTDSSTILVPVYASALGLSAAAGDFSYTVASYTVENAAATDEFSSWAKYNPWSRAIEDGGGLTVARNSRASLPILTNAASFSAQRPSGLMVVVQDNQSGSREALLVRMR